MNVVTVHPMHVRGQRFDIQVAEDGTWMTTAGPERVYGKTRDELKSKLMDLTAKASAVVAIPFVLASSRLGRLEVLRGVVTGIHGGNGNLLIMWTEGGRRGQKEQWIPSHNDLVFEGAMTQEEIDAWMVLKRAARAAHDELSDFERLRKIDLQDRARKAVEEAVRESAS